eukprot:TRINITY_DN24779_c0_g1_i1.p1 TRINITY_DN24779_c0_g1~~TRINITY_DN24779_c0_g1_i1.p1  ORF type:complete len:134 (-),score=22.54 TRINITY_DN24779_c0_g1_i1:148-549(-)
MCADVRTTEASLQNSGDSGDSAKQSPAQSSDSTDDIDFFLSGMLVCPPCSSGDQMPQEYPTDLADSSQGTAAETGEEATGSGAVDARPRRSTWIGRAAWSLGEYAADALLPQCSCHDVISGFLAHGISGRRRF